jgi:acetamidase/formamidase
MPDHHVLSSAPETCHWGFFDAALPPALTVHSGDTVMVESVSGGREHLPPSSDRRFEVLPDHRAVHAALSPRMPGHILTGPIAVDGAEPGDTLAVEILDLHTQGWGWTAILPGLGLLPDDFPDAYLRIFDISGGDFAYMRDDVAIPLAPFLGTMGVCPAGASAQPVMPPGNFGGNMDTRQLVRGTTLFLPVQVEGALFSCGDAHGCQGDGEVCVTGLEAPMYASLRFTVEKGRSIPSPQFRTAPGPLTPRVDVAGFYGTTGVGPDLYRGAQDAIRAMVSHINGTYGLSPEDAYLLASLAVDLKISEIVDAGQYIVSAVLPESIFMS